jgi:TetR/AcrR family transcriptional regulator, cholesterol catabolism regulator
MDVSSEELGRRERRRLEVQDRLRAAAASLFKEKGYDATTVEEIAERADVAKGTLFNHFPRKDALLLALRDTWVLEVMESVGADSAWQGTHAEWLRRLFHRFAELAQRHPDLAKAMAIEGMRSIWLQPGVPAEQLEFRRLLTRRVAAGQAAGEFLARLDPCVAAAMLEGVYGMTVVEWLVAGTNERSLIGELDARLDVLFRGISAAGMEEGGVR